MSAYVYILRLESGNLYIGSTRDIDARCEDHYQGRACRTTRIDPPIELVYSEETESLTIALKRENQLKRWSRAKKEALIANDIEELKRLSKSRTRETNKRLEPPEKGAIDSQRLLEFVSLP